MHAELEKERREKAALAAELAEYRRMHGEAARQITDVKMRTNLSKLRDQAEHRTPNATPATGSAADTDPDRTHAAHPCGAIRSARPPDRCLCLSFHGALVPPTTCGRLHDNHESNTHTS